MLKAVFGDVSAVDRTIIGHPAWKTDGYVMELVIYQHSQFIGPLPFMPAVCCGENCGTNFPALLADAHFCLQTSSGFGRDPNKTFPRYPKSIRLTNQTVTIIPVGNFILGNFPSVTKNYAYSSDQQTYCGGASAK